MAEMKTKPTDASVDDFLNAIADDQTRQDTFTLVDIMRKATKSEPQMWGDSIVGFGDYRYRYANGREAEWFLIGFSPRKQNLALYIMAGFEPDDELLQALGKYKTAKSCLYIKRLADIHLPTLRKLVQRSVSHLRQVGTWPNPRIGLDQTGG